MSDEIWIRELRVQTHVGWSDEERAAPQGVVVSVGIFSDLSAAGASDDLADTIDYSETATRVADVVRRSQSRLLENLAERVARAIAPFEGVEKVSVEIAKEVPPMREDVGSVTVRIERP